MGFDHEGSRGRAAAMIERWGTVTPAFLLRDGVLRPCKLGVLDYNPTAKGLDLENGERVLIAAPLDVPPNHELDKVVKSGKVYEIVLPVKGPRPGDVTIFYDVMIVYEGAYP